MVSVHFVNGKFVVQYQQDAHGILEVFQVGTPAKFVGQIKLPGIGTVEEVRAGFDQPELFFRFTSFSDPGTIFRVDMNTLAVEVVYKTEL